MKAVKIYHIITFLLSQNSSQIALSFKILKVNKTTVKLFINDFFYFQETWFAGGMKTTSF